VIASQEKSPNCCHLHLHMFQTIIRLTKIPSYPIIYMREWAIPCFDTYRNTELKNSIISKCLNTNTYKCSAEMFVCLCCHSICPLQIACIYMANILNSTQICLIFSRGTTKVSLERSILPWGFDKNGNEWR